MGCWMHIVTALKIILIWILFSFKLKHGEYVAEVLLNLGYAQNVHKTSEIKTNLLNKTN